MTLAAAESDITVAERNVAIAGLRIHLAEAGAGPPIFVLHHSIGPLWTPFCTELAREMTVTAPDLPGYGQSECPTWARSPRTLAILCVQLFDMLELPAVNVVGLGFGGWVAAELVAMNQSRVASLVLVGAAGIRPTSGTIHDPIAAGFSDYVALGFHERESFFRLFGDPVSDELWDLWDRSREMTCRLTWKPWMFNDELPYCLRAVRTPTLLVWGTSDRIVPRDCAERYLEVLEQARLRLVDESGHNVDLEHPAVLAQLVIDHVQGL